MWKNKLVTVVVLCFFIYEAGNYWNKPRTVHRHATDDNLYNIYILYSRPA